MLCLNRSAGLMKNFVNKKINVDLSFNWIPVKWNLSVCLSDFYLGYFEEVNMNPDEVLKDYEILQKTLWKALKKWTSFFILFKKVIEKLNRLG